MFASNKRGEGGSEGKGERGKGGERVIIDGTVGCS